VTRDVIAGLAILAASLALFVLTLDLKDSPLVPIGPGFYPRIVLGVTAAFAAALVVIGFLESRKAPPAGEAAKGKPNYALVALSFGVFGLYCAALPALGFRIATFLYVVASTVTLAPPRAAKGWVAALVLGLATAFLTWLVFERYLSVLLPRGRWTNF
jgi:putative tricarboxylic transport membrane protein